MNLRNISAVILICLCLLREAIAVNQNIATPRGFLIYRTVSIAQRTCNCSMSFSCSCCQNVIILYTKMERNLCVNFTYQRNGLNIDVALSSTTINTRTIMDFKAFQFCIYIPGCLFSTACINVLELIQFPRSITACLRLDIFAKKRLWQINYDCMSVSTELPMMSNATMIPGTSREGNGPNGQSPTTDSTTRMTLSVMTVAQTTEMSSTGTSGMAEQEPRTTEVSEMIID